MSTLQNFKGYHTGYNYGVEGTPKAARFIRDHVAGDSRASAPSETIYYLNLPSPAHLLDRFWNDKEELLKRLADPKTSAFAYSIATNTVD